jgi:aryl-alcohol dehydrogenase-like predicted oxidoreductase
MGAIAMKYRELGSTGLRISEIGVGTEYLVKASRSEIKDLVKTAVNAGCNYFDILFDAPEYLNGFGEAFEDIRDRVVITAHIPTLDSIERGMERFQDFLERVKCGYVDILFISCCDREEVYNAVTDLSGKPADEVRIRTLGQEYCLKNHGGHLRYAKELQKQGLVNYLGFSTHVLPMAMRAVKDGYFDVLMFPVNPVFDTLPGKAGRENLSELWDSDGTDCNETLCRRLAVQSFP